MDDLDLDRILAADDPVVPSRAFTARVMAAVDASGHEEAALPFPWARVALGVCACGASAASLAWSLSAVDASAAVQSLTGVPGLSEALLTAALSVSVAQVLRRRVQAGS